MATFLIFTALLLTILEGIVGTVDQHSERSPRNFKRSTKELCNLNPYLCVPAVPPNPQNSRKHCSNNSDCGKNEYCHQFHQICVKSTTTPKTLPVLSRPASKCAQSSDCKRKEYCHEMWKLCLPMQEISITPTTKRPSWYCHTTRDCGIDQQCHRMFHTCYNKPPISAVRRSDANSRTCRNKNDCGTGSYCHDHFKLCLAIKTDIIFKDQPIKKNTCTSDKDCNKGMACHDRWEICYKTPPPPKAQQTVRNDQRHTCQLDSDCKKDEFCHYRQDMVFRHRRDIQRVCLPLSSRTSIIKPLENEMCKSDVDCGRNKCCLQKLGVCLAYQMPGSMCLLQKTDFVCPCSRGSFCMNRGKLASPKRIINKMKLSQPIAKHMLTTHKKKYQVGKCMPGSG